MIRKSLCFFLECTAAFVVMGIIDAHIAATPISTQSWTDV
jgi:hypothetical protein